MEEETNLIPRTGSPELFPPPIHFSQNLALFAAASAIFLCLVGVTGNLLTVVALTRDKKLRQQATTTFVISLAFSDLLFCAINLPLTAVRYIQQEWTLGPVLCRMFPFLFYGNVAASLMSMVAITINRYVLIAYYGYYNRIYSSGNILLMLAAVWIFSFGMIFPPLVDVWGTLGLDEATFSCTIKKLDGKSPKKFLFLVAFLLPSISILVCYSAIFYRVKSSRHNVESHSHRTPCPIAKTKAVIRAQRMEDLKLTKMMLTIFLLFLICFLPLMLVNVLDDFIRQPYIHIIASVLAWTSATINPILYSFLNQQYQKAFRTLLCLPGIRQKPPVSGSHSGALSCNSLGVKAPDFSKSCSLASSARGVELKYFSQSEDFSIVHEEDVHTQRQFQCMGRIRGASYGCC